MTPTVFSAIVGLLSALPQLIGLANSIWSWLDRVSQGNVVQMLKDLAIAIDQLNNAKTPEEKTNAAKALSDYISRLPSR